MSRKRIRNHCGNCTFQHEYKCFELGREDVFPIEKYSFSVDYEFKIKCGAYRKKKKSQKNV